MKIYLSGATGFIGSHTLQQLVEDGFDVRISVREKSNLKNIQKYPKKIEIFEGDLTNLDFAKRCVSGCDAVIHLAGWVQVAVSKRFREEVWNSNYKTTENMFTSCLENKTKKVVFLGSLFGLGKGEGRTAADENVNYNLGDLASKITYAKAKRQCEILRDNFLSKGLPVVTVYPNFCFGEGDIYLSSSVMIYPFLKGKMKILFDMGVNVQWVGDAARSLILSLEKGKIGEKYLSGGENLETAEIFKILSQITGVPLPRTKVDPKFLRILFRFPDFALEKIEDIFRKTFKMNMGMALISSKQFWFYSDSKIRKELGYKSIPARETLKRAAEWLMKNRK